MADSVCTSTAWVLGAAGFQTCPQCTRFFDVCIKDRSERLTEALARIKELEDQNDPQWDATDGAHPAWWRGHDNGAKGMLDVKAKLEAQLRAAQQSATYWHGRFATAEGELREAEALRSQAAGKEDSGPSGQKGNDNERDSARGLRRIRGFHGVEELPGQPDAEVARATGEDSGSVESGDRGDNAGGPNRPVGGAGEGEGQACTCWPWTGNKWGHGRECPSFGEPAPSPPVTPEPACICTRLPHEPGESNPLCPVHSLRPVTPEQGEARHQLNEYTYCVLCKRFDPSGTCPGEPPPSPLPGGDGLDSRVKAGWSPPPNRPSEQGDRGPQWIRDSLLEVRVCLLDAGETNDYHRILDAVSFLADAVEASLADKLEAGGR